MKNKISIALIVFSLVSISSCSQDEKPLLEQEFVNPGQEKTEPHSYGGWYCPDNLYVFPAVDIADWKKVPVVTGRLCTQEESRNGTSLIFVDTAEYPNAKPLDIAVPQLASIYNLSSQREEVIIVIQAINVQNDSIVGFRYLNGGNGSAHLHEIKFISEEEVELNSISKFVDLEIEIDASQEDVWKIMTNKEHLAALTPTFESGQQLKKDWRSKTNINYAYAESGNSTALFGDVHFGNYYIQNDYDNQAYSEKFFLTTTENNKTTLKVTCGPFNEDYQSQNESLKNWAQKVKELSE